ncbi:MAG TPA: fused MFS/spermidine synthase, partial [Terriglobales bacterium]
IAFALVSAYLAFKTRIVNVVAAANPEENAAPSATLVAKALWVLLPMAAAMQLSAITSHLTANIAAIPLLWILPLAVYLLTLILAFQSPRLLPRGVLVRLLVLVLASVAYMMSKTDFSWPIWLMIPFFLLALFVACLFCHVEACALRPQRSAEATLFYLLFAAGGALGSFWIGIVSPHLSRFNYDLPLTFFFTALLALAATWRVHWSQRLLWSATCIVMLVVTGMVRIAYHRKTMVAVRNFYGSLRVTQDQSSIPGATLRTLLNGSIQHGTQIFGTDEQRHTPTTYYAEDSGVGLALHFCCEDRARNIGVVGLGAGTIAAYGRPGDRIRFYEINPADIPIARNVFRYIRDSGAQVDIVEGDARTSLTNEPPQKYDVLVVDAFSGDAIPLHLLTKEALALYRRHLAPDGIIAFHISNQHVNLGPPIALLAASAGMQVRRIANLSNDPRGTFSSTWMLVSDNAAFFTRPEVATHAVVPESKPGLRVWTDDYSALLPVMRW